MRVGISSATFYPYTNTEDCFERMSKLGFNCGEIFLNSICEYEEDFVKELMVKKEEYNFDVISIHAFGSIFEPFLFDQYDRRRKDLFKFFKSVCKAASMLGAKYYTFHGMRLGNFQELNKSFIIDIYDELCYIACENGIKLSQENVSWCMSSIPEFLNMIKDKCKYPLSFTLDIKQAYKAGISPERYMEIMKEFLGNIHVNDRDEEHVCLLPGRGTVDYRDFLSRLKEIGYKGDGIIEVYKSNYINEEELTESKIYVESTVRSIGI